MTDAPAADVAAARSSAGATRMARMRARWRMKCLCYVSAPPPRDSGLIAGLPPRRRWSRRLLPGILGIGASEPEQVVAVQSGRRLIPPQRRHAQQGDVLVDDRGHVARERRHPAVDGD